MTLEQYINSNKDSILSNREFQSYRKFKVDNFYEITKNTFGFDIYVIVKINRIIRIQYVRSVNPELMLEYTVLLSNTPDMMYRVGETYTIHIGGVFAEKIKPLKDKSVS